MPELEDQINAMLNYSSAGGDQNDPEPESSGEPSAEPSEPAGDKGTPPAEPPKDPQGKAGDQNEPPQDPELPAEPEPSEPPDELEKLKSENEHLKGKIQEILKQQSQSTQSPAEPEFSLGDFDPIGEADIEDIIETPETFKKWAQTAFQNFGKQVVDSLKQQLPNMVKAQASDTVSQTAKANEFYRLNSDLEPYKPYVAYKMQQLAASEENKTKGIDDLLKKTAEAVRADLKLEEPSKDPGTTSSRSPGLPKGGSKSSSRSKKAEPELSGVEKEIQEMLTTIEQED